MDEVISKINELHGVLQEKINKHSQLIDETNALNSDLLERASELSAREADLNKREFAVEQVENVVNLKAEAEKLMAQVDKDRIELEKARTSWRTACDIEKQNMQNERAVLDQEARNNEANRKNLEEEVNKRVTELLGKMRK